MSRIRVIRVMIYEGEEQHLWKSVEQNAVPMDGQKNFGGLLIKSAMVGFPEVIDTDEITERD